MTAPHHTDEKVLFERIAEGDEHAFRELYHLYGRLLYPFLSQLTGSEDAPEDLIQETLLRVWLNRDQLPDVDYPRAWIFRTASNLAYTWLKRNTLHQQAVHQLSPARETAEADPVSNLTIQAIRQVVHRTLDHMSPQRRTIYRMHREQGMKTTEIAAQLGISNSTVKNTLIAAARLIREQLETAGYSLPLWLIALFFKK